MKAASVILIVLSVLLASCGNGDAWRSMDEADSLMEQSPDSALALLEAIDSAAVSGRRMRARHALLTTQAHVKTDRLTISDTAALPLLDYYNDHGPDFDRMRAAFYKAWVYYINGNHIKAIRELSSAYDIADKRNDYYWLAKIFDLKADLYDLNGIHNEAIKARTKTIDFYQKAAKDINADYARCDLSMDYKNGGNSGKALRILNRLIAEHRGIENIESNLRCYLLHYLVAIHYSVADYVRADSCQRLLDSLSDSSYDNYGACKMRAFIAAKLNKPTADSLMNVYRSVLTDGSDSALYYNMLRNLAYSRGNLKLANTLADSIIIYQNSEVSRVLQQSLPREELLIQIDKNEISKEDNHKLSLAVIILIISIVTMVIAYRIRISLLTRKKDKEVQKVKDMLVQFMYEKENNENTVGTTDNDNVSQILLLYRDYVRKLLKICHKYDESQSRKHKSAEHEQIVGILKRFGSQKELQRMYETVNSAYNGILDHLKNIYGKQYDESSATIILLFAGFNPPIIALILDDNINTIYTRRKRLVSRLQALDIPIKEICISAIS